MPSISQQLFDPDADHAAILAEWGLTPTIAQLRIHQALAMRTVSPHADGILEAAGWLESLYRHHREHAAKSAPHILSALDEKSRMLHRLSYKYAPAIAGDLEQPSSKLFALDSAARLLPSARPDTIAAIDTLRSAVQRHLLPNEAPPGSDPEWHRNRVILRDLIQQDNPLRFLTWPVIINSMFMDDSKVAAPELAALQAESDFTAKWEPALQEDAIGAPSRTPLLSGSSNNLIHHAYSLLQLKIHAHVNISQLSTIVEFGGGYGSLARLAFRLGFRGTYVIFDLPEFAALQQFYLGCLGLPAAGCVRWSHSVEELEEIAPRPDLFIALWSLSETPLEFRAALLPAIQASRRHLIAYQHMFSNVDNGDYFRQVASALSASASHDLAIPHLPGNRYLITSTAPAISPNSQGSR